MRTAFQMGDAAMSGLPTRSFSFANDASYMNGNSHWLVNDTSLSWPPRFSPSSEFRNQTDLGQKWILGFQEMSNESL